MRRVVLAAVLVLAAGGLSAGQDAGKEKLSVYKPRAGDRTRTVKTDVTDMTVALDFGGQKKDVPVKTTATEDYTEEVLAVADGKPTKLTRAYAKARVEGGKDETKSYEGKTVLIEKGKDGKYAFTVNGAAVPEADAKGLDKSFNNPNKLDDEDMLPPGPVAAGDKWDLPKKSLEKFNESDGDMTIDGAKSKVTVTLAKSYAKGGKRFSTLKPAATLRVTQVKLGDNAVPLADGSVMKFDSTIDACFDGTSPAGGETTTITFNLSGDLPNGTIKLTGTSKLTKTVEVLGQK